LIGIIGTIFLGALGSGLWQIVLSPLVYKVGKVFLNLLSPFFIFFINNIYIEIAKGLHESHSLALLGLFVGGCTGFLGTIVFIHIYLRNKVGSDKSLPNLLANKKIYYTWVMAAVFSISFLTGSYFIEGYVNVSITRFEQTLDICSPYITQSEVLEFRSQFAQIKSRIDYENIINSLRDIAKDNKLCLPRNSFWY
jgi:hypothetical protein